MVCLACDNSDHMLILAIAILVAGGSFCCAYPKDPYTELLYLAKKVEPRLLFCHSRNLNWAKQLSTDLGFEVVGVPMDEPANKTDSSSPGWFGDLFDYDYRIKSKSIDKLPVPTVKPLDKQVAMILMSSGTTGKPKAVSQSHWNCIVDFAPERRARSDNSSFVCVTSLDYVSGRSIMFGAINHGYNAVLLKGSESTSILEAIERHKLEVIYLGAASFYALITYKHLDKYNISSLKCVLPFGAKILYLDALREFFSKHPHIVQVRQGYGASELSGICMNTMAPQEYLLDCANCGRILPGSQAKVIDPDTGRLLGPNEQGLICVRGETVFPGYYDMEQARRLKADEQKNDLNDSEDLNPFIRDASVFDSEGYYITGDLVYFNDKEELYVIGRYKEVMNCRCTKKVLPQELEEVIIAHPVVSSVCVLGIQSKRELGLHCPRAFVVVKPEFYDVSKEELSSVNSRSLSDESEQLEHVGEHKLCKMNTERRRMIAEDIMEFVNARVGWKKQLTGGVVILDEIPISRTTGKMNKNYLRALDLDQIEIYGDRST
uniref:Putative 4-coumarate--CoA ligase 3 n=1 Tax=Aceria tosichella TaxID=561515 RepID=A0A6G1SPW2_9ACAR